MEEGSQDEDSCESRALICVRQRGCVVLDGRQELVDIPDRLFMFLLEETIRRRASIVESLHALLLTEATALAHHRSRLGLAAPASCQQKRQEARIRPCQVARRSFEPLERPAKPQLVR